jgi:hypothetical protein
MWQESRMDSEMNGYIVGVRECSRTRATVHHYNRVVCVYDCVTFQTRANRKQYAVSRIHTPALLCKSRHYILLHHPS